MTALNCPLRIMTLIAAVVGEASVPASPFEVRVTNSAEAREVDDWAPENLRDRSRLRSFSYSSGVGRDEAGQKYVFAVSLHGTIDRDDAPLPHVASHGYSLHAPQLAKGDLIFLLGQIYETAGVSTQAPFQRNSLLRRVKPEEIPVALQRRADTYVFPLRDEERKSTLQYSGTLHGHYIYVWEIKRAAAKADAWEARVGILKKGSESQPQDRVDDINWQTVRLDETLRIGKTRHKVVNLQPLIPPDELKRGKARMVGWLELEAMPLEADR
jgi:hypothetical protein